MAEKQRFDSSDLQDNAKATIPHSRPAPRVWRSLSILAFVIVFCGLHFIQLIWLEGKCGAHVPLDLLPESCQSRISRLWLFPAVAAALLALVLLQRGRFETWKAASRATANFLSSILTWSAQGRALTFWASLPVSLLTTLTTLFSRNGLSILDSMSTGWLSRGDAAQAYLGSVLYRSEPWSFPLGRLTKIMDPLGSNVAFTDPVFLLALVGKIFANHLTPEAQFFGAWLFACYVLFAIGCCLVVSHFRLPLVSSIAAAGILSLFPPLFFRQEHFTLNMLALMPFSVFAILRQQQNGSSRKPAHFQGALLLISAWLHPYLSVLFGVFFLFHLHLLFRSKNWSKWQIATLAFSAAMSVGLSWWLIGYVGSGIPASESPWPSYYTANLNTFFNPLQKSAFLKALPLATGGQYEGFGYLGLGVLLGLLVLIAKEGRAAFLSCWQNERALCLAFLMGLVLSQGCLLSFSIWKLDLPFWGYGQLLSPFRSTGRFIWIPCFLLTVLMISYLSKVHQERNDQSLSLFLVLLLGVQWLDLRPFRESSQISASQFSPVGLATGSSRASEEQKWAQLLNGKKRVIAYPPYTEKIAHTGDYALFWWLALRHNVKVNVGYVSRFDEKESAHARARLLEVFKNEDWDQDSLYVVKSSDQTLLSKKNGLSCALISDYFACQKVTNDLPL